MIKRLHIHAYQPIRGATYDAISVWVCRRCSALFTALYRVIYDHDKETGRLLGQAPLLYLKPEIFPETVGKISPTFVEAYNQALRAEENGLNEICGAGYRRALEFLVKDFLISHLFSAQPDRHDEVRHFLLGKCVRDFLPDGPIKEAALRAAWLGNDETHYYRKWTGRDLTDLKVLISLATSWIDLTVKLDEYMLAMPDKRPEKKRGA